MKKRTLLAGVIISTLLLTGCTAAQKEVEHVGMEEAKAAALDAAGLSSEEVKFSHVELDDRNGQKYYDVDFTANNLEYEYDVDALTGKVISHRGPETDDKETKDDSRPAAEAPAKAEAPAANSQGELIGEDKAKAIAMEHAGVTEDKITFVKSGLDRDDGRRVYDVEFYTSDYTEYDYDIDAYSGEILSFDHDAEYYAPKNSKENTGSVKTAEGGITEAKAKEIALSQVPGATADDIWEFETDYDDGRLEYEGKIYYDHMEYEFEIDGYSGAIRNWEVESIYD